MTDVPSKVETLLERVADLEQEREVSAARVASLELKAATAGKLGWMDFVKIGMFAASLSGGISWIAQTFIRAELAEALVEVRIAQARTETAVVFLKEEAEPEKGGAE